MCGGDNGCDIVLTLRVNVTTAIGVSDPVFDITALAKYRCVHPLRFDSSSDSKLVVYSGCVLLFAGSIWRRKTFWLACSETTGCLLPTLSPFSPSTQYFQVGRLM